MLRFFFFSVTVREPQNCQMSVVSQSRFLQNSWCVNVFNRSSAFVSVYSVVFSPQHSRSSDTFTDRCHREFSSWNCLQLKKCCYLTVRYDGIKEYKQFICAGWEAKSHVCSLRSKALLDFIGSANGCLHNLQLLLANKKKKNGGN